MDNRNRDMPFTALVITLLMTFAFWAFLVTIMRACSHETPAARERVGLLFVPPQMSWAPASATFCMGRMPGLFITTRGEGYV